MPGVDLLVAGFSFAMNNTEQNGDLGIQQVVPNSAFETMRSLGLGEGLVHPASGPKQCS